MFLKHSQWGGREGGGEGGREGGREGVRGGRGGVGGVDVYSHSSIGCWWLRNKLPRRLCSSPKRSWAIDDRALIKSHPTQWRYGMACMHTNSA